MDFRDERAQLSMDLLIAVSIFMLSVSAAIYYAVSAFTPYSDETLTLQSCAYRVAMILAESPGLNVTNITVVNGTLKATLLTNWQTALKNGNGEFVRDGNVTLVGLAEKAPPKSSYDTCIPCCLNETKVEVFFNKTVWRKVVGWGSNYLENLSNLIGLGMYEGYGKNVGKVSLFYNISLEYMNGSVVKLDGVTCQIGYSLPVTGNVAKFERIVVMYNASKNYFEASDFRRLVVYVW